MISKNLKRLREKVGMTQKELADKLFVSPQAVSRWENGDTEPSVATLDSIAEIFGVSLDELFGRTAPEPEKEVIYTAAPAVLGVCDTCKKAVTDPDDYVKTYHFAGRTRVEDCRCKECDERLKKQAYDNAVSNGVKCRNRSFIWGSLITAAILGVTLGVTLSGEFSAKEIIGFTVTALLFFPFLSCIFLKNNFVEDMFGAVATFGFVRFRGLIFSLDLDGIIWFLTVKLLFWIIGIVLAIVAFLLALALGLLVSVFVYPFALNKSIKHPEQTDLG